MGIAQIMSKNEYQRLVTININKLKAYNEMDITDVYASVSTINKGRIVNIKV